MYSEKIKEYISKNWANTIKSQGNEAKTSFIKMAKPYTVPCISRTFLNFYYWDTYFTNLGLIEEGNYEQVENNLDNMAFFVDKLGFIPNSDILITRSQPPFFCRGVYDYYKATGKKEIIFKYKAQIEKEFVFWQMDRKTPCGLYAYKNSATQSYLAQFYDEMIQDGRIDFDAEKTLSKLELSASLLAIAESGWDFNPRFMTERSRYDSLSFAHLDLNCILHDAFVKFAEMMQDVGETALRDKYQQIANELKAKMDELMLDKASGIYYDYNFKDGTLSKILSYASFYVYFAGVSDDTKACREVIRRLESPYGYSACEKREDSIFGQWDFPKMWPPCIYLAYDGLEKIGLKEDAKKLAGKYVDALEKVFEQTGQLWEKYDAEKCEVSDCFEYVTPEMLGWTAGTYLYLINKLQK